MEGRVVAQDLLNEFEAKRERLQQTFTKLAELTSEATEHEVVIGALEPMDKNRKCFRLVGDVLVERTVGETLPAVQGHKQQLEQVITMLQKTLDGQRKELADFQAKHKIRIKGEDDEDQPAPAGSSGAGPSGSQGVLVAKS